MFSSAQLRNFSSKYLFILKNALVFFHFHLTFTMFILSYSQLLHTFDLLDTVFTFPFGGHFLFYSYLDLVV